MAQYRGCSSGVAQACVEVDKYMNEYPIDWNDDPLRWRVERKFVYPKLFSVMERRLCIPATSVPCERICSKAGQLLSERRTRLSDKKVSELIFFPAKSVICGKPQR